MTLALPYRVVVARSHALWVIGMAGQAVFRELMPLSKFQDEVRLLRIAFANAERDEESLERLKLETATIEETLAELANAKRK